MQVKFVCIKEDALYLHLGACKSEYKGLLFYFDLGDGLDIISDVFMSS